LKQLFYRWMLPKLISRTCGFTIPRSGEEGEKVNCYVVALDREDSPFFVAVDYKGQILKGLKWNGYSYADDYSLDLAELENGKLRVTHYYGLSEIRYDNIYDIVWHHLTKLIYLKINLYRRIDSAHQYFFNNQKLVTKKRMELIVFMMNDQLDRTHNGIDPIDLMTKLYSINWVLHPSGDQQQRKLELYLDSLVSSGELGKVNNEYVVLDKAISTIERYEEEERRHSEAVKQQRYMVVLTIVLVLVGIVQSGLIKLPTLLNLSK
jgi:hypothetical protein